MTESEESAPWIEKSRFGHYEVNTMGQKIIVNCSANEVIEIDKLYGPLCAVGVRIRLEYNDKCSDWVVEREKLNDGPEDSEWIEMARWHCQLDWPSKSEESE